MKKLIYLILISLILILIYSIYNIFIWVIDNKETDNLIKKVNSVSKISGGNNYFNFKNLKKINSDTVAWIKIDNTLVNYPVVQAKDNSYYLNHSFDKSYNAAGWVFLDYRNKLDDLDQNTLIFAHGRADKTMFGSLRDILNKKSLDDVFIKLYLENDFYSFEAFSIYRIKTTNDYMYNNFIDEKDYNNFINMIKNRGVLKKDIDFNFNDKIITLSTCFNSTEKLVIHGKLNF